MHRDQGRWTEEMRPNYGVWDRHQRRYRWVSLLLVMTMLAQLVMPVWALPAPKRRPFERTPLLEASAERGLRKAGNPLPQLPGMEGVDGYFPQDPESLAQVDPTPDEPPSDTSKPDEPKRYPVTQENLEARRRQAEESEKQAALEKSPPPQQEKEKSSSPHRSKDPSPPNDKDSDPEEPASDSHEDRPEEHHHHHARKTRSFAVITPPGQLSAPRSDWSRLTSPKGSYFEVASGEMKTFANDHAVVVSRNIAALANPGHETILWEFISPVAENNGVGPHHNAAGAIQFDYFSSGTSADGRYRVSVRTWDNRRKSGHSLKDIQRNGALLKQYQAFAACACRDTGQWTFKAYRGGKVIETTTWEVAEPPMPTTEWARRVHSQYNAVTASPYVAWVGDEWLMHMKDFVFPAPDANLDLKDQPASVRGTTVEWNWSAPAVLKLNRTCFRTYLTVKLHYKVHQAMVNGQRSFSHTLKTVVYDSSYPNGRVYKSVEGPGLIAHTALNYGTGIPALSDWTMNEKINGVKSPALTFKARYLGTSVQAPRVGYVDNGLTYNMQISTGPLDYVEKTYTWKLHLRDEGGKVVRTFTGAINDNDKNYIELHQDFDGLDGAGQPIALGSVLQPEFVVQVPKSTPSLARTAALAAPSQAQIAFAQMQASSGTNTSTPPSPSPLRTQAAAITTASTTQFWSNVTNTTGGFTNVDIFAVEISHGTNGATVDVPVVIPIDFSNIVPATPQVQVTVGAPSTHSYAVSYNDIKLDNQVLVATTPLLTRGQNIAPLTTTVTPGIHTFTGLCTVGGFSQAFPFYGSWGLHLQLTYPSQIADLVPQTESLAVGTQKTLMTNAGIINAAGSRQVLNGGSQAPVRVVRPNGTFDTVYTDLALRTGGIPINISRYWSPSSSFDLGDPYTVYLVGNRRVQFGWAWNFQRDLILSSDQKRVTYRKPEGGEDTYALDANNLFKAVRLDDTKKLTQPGGPGNDFLLTDKSGYQLRFQLATVLPNTPPTPRRAFLTQERDFHGNTLQYTYSDIGSGMFCKTISSNNGQSVTLSWADATTDPARIHNDPAGFQYSQLSSLRDHTGREVKYSYLTVPDPAFPYLGLLETVSQPGGRTLTHHYDMAGLIQPSVTANTQAIPAWVFQANPVQIQTLIDFLKQNPENINANLTGVDVNGVPRLRLETDPKIPIKLAQVSHPGLQTQTYQQLSPFQVAITNIPQHAPPTVQPPQTWTHTLDASQRVVATRDPLGVTERFAFDPAHNLTNYIDGKQENAVTMTWDSHRNVRSVTDKLQHRTDFDYNSNDDLISIQDAQTPRGIRTFTYGGPENRELRQVSGPEAGHVEQFVYDAQGHLIQHIGAMGQLWKQTYVGGFLKNRIAPDGSTWTFDNDALGRPTRVILPQNGVNGRIITTTYDTRDRVTVTNNSGAVTTRGYNANDQLTTLTLPPTPTNPQRRPTQYIYDAYMRVRQVNLPDGSTVLYQRDDFGNVVNMTNPRGAVTGYGFDSLNRVTSVTYPAPAGKESYHYNDLGQMDVWTKTDGNQIKYDFDEVGNLKTLSSGGNVQASFGYDSINRVVQMDDSAGRTVYEYTLGSNLQAVTRPGNRRLEYSFDFSDRLTRTLDPEGKVTLYDYTPRDELKTATTDGFSALYKYNPVGTLANAEYRLGVNSIVGCAYGYDGRDRLASKSYSAGSNPLLSMTWAFDNLDRRTQMTMDFPQGHVQRNFGYNDRDELANSSTFIRPASGNATNSTATYATDANHNRTRLSGNTTNTTNYTNNLADQTTAAGTLTLDFNGAGAVNQTTQVGTGTQKFVYDYKDQLTQFVAGPTTVSYKYDANNRLTARNATVGTSSNSSTFLWDGETLAKEYDAGGNVTKRYFGREAVYQNGHWHLLLSDHQGSIVGAVNDQGQHEFTNLYSDFGALTKQYPGTAAVGGIGTDLDYQWTGERMDRNTGFIYMRNRHYQPALGKFLQRDPIGYAGGMNVYSFAGGDGINFVDPSGLDFGTKIFGVGRAASRFLPPATAVSSAADQVLLNSVSKVAPTTVGRSSGLWVVVRLGGAFVNVLISAEPVGSKTEDFLYLGASNQQALSTIKSAGGWSPMPESIMGRASSIEDKDAFFGFLSGLENVSRRKTYSLTAEQADTIIKLGKSFGIETWLQDGHETTSWNQLHLHMIGDRTGKRFHLTVPTDYSNSDAPLNNSK